jgi:circadian clock protein KaiB
VRIYTFILYIAGDSPNSVQALTNLKAICAENFPDGHQLEVVDLVRDPHRGLRDGIIVAPTLVKLDPKPKQVIFGNLSDVSTVLASISRNSTSK